MERKGFKFNVNYLESQGLFRVIFGDEGREQSKVIDARALISLLNDSLMGESVHLDLVHVGPSPENYLGGDIDMGLFSGSLYYAVDGGVRPVRYEKGEDKYTCCIDFPKMIFEVHVNQKRFETLYVYCYEGDLNAETLLYELPLSNVYKGGKICSGHSASNFPEFSDFYGINRVLDVFFSSVYNGDLWEPLKYGCAFPEQLKKLEKEGCKFECMVPVGKYSTVCRSLFNK